MTYTVPKTALQLRSHLKASGELELSLAEVAVPRQLFASILERIGRLSQSPALCPFD